jgi:hypothetical protein
MILSIFWIVSSRVNVSSVLPNRMPMPVFDLLFRKQRASDITP